MEEKFKNEREFYQGIELAKNFRLEVLYELLLKELKLEILH